MDHVVTLAQHVHSEAVGDLPVLLGHEQIQDLGGQQSQRFPVDQLQLTALGAIHHLKIQREILIPMLTATDFEVKTTKRILVSDEADCPSLQCGVLNLST